MPHELFVRRLHQMLSVEERLADELLPRFYDDVHAIDLKYGLERHLFETRQHVMTVRTILHLLGERQDPVESPAFVVGPGATELELCGQLAQIEHFEIASYTFLRTLANALGYDDIGIRLTEVLEQEEYALELVQKATAKLLAESVANP
jgi:ferritin-like metal-binding protein YciE